MTDKSDKEIQSDDDSFIGEIIGFDQKAEYEQAIQKQEADTTRRLAFLSVLMLGGYILLHYIATIIIGIWGPNSLLTPLKDIFSAALPVLSGLAGSAATYFFTRNRT